MPDREPFGITTRQVASRRVYKAISFFLRIIRRFLCVGIRFGFGVVVLMRHGPHTFSWASKRIAYHSGYAPEMGDSNLRVSLTPPHSHRRLLNLAARLVAKYALKLKS